MASRTLSESEFNNILNRLLDAAPAGLSEADFNRWLEPRLAFEVGRAEQLPAEPEGSALGRLAEGAWENLNPVALAKGAWGAVRHPINTLSDIGQAQLGQWEQAKARAGEGRFLEAAGHGAAALVPLIGPASAAAGERIAEGDVAGGVGEGLGLLAPVGIPRAVKAGVETARTAIPAAVQQTAGMLEKGAARRVARVMSPEVGANKTRFGRMAEEAAPAVLETGDVGGWSRQGLQGRIQEGLGAAEEALDAAADARLAGRAYKTGPIVKDLVEKRAARIAEAIKGSQLPGGFVRPKQVPGTGTVVARGSTPIGSDVVPGPYAARVAMIDEAIAEVQKLGKMARYESLRTIRQAYDGPAKAIYNPSMTADFLKAQGGKLGAADVTGVLREHLAKFDPATAQANAKYSLYRKASDVLEAAAEVERVRPTVGRRIMSRLVGATAGGAAAGLSGALVGAVLAPSLEAALSSGFTIRLQTARLMHRLATAIRSSNFSSVDSLIGQLKRVGAQGAVLTGKTTNPSGFQAQPAEVRSGGM